MYQERTYRTFCSSELNNIRIEVEESDLMISYSHSIEGLNCKVRHIREIIKQHIEKENLFLTSLKPLADFSDEPQIIQHMKKASRQCNVGPMATIAAAVSMYISKDIVNKNTDLIIENGGDIFVKTSKERRILIHAGNSLLSDRLSIKISPTMSPIGICTSSGKLGHSLSFGKADAVVVISKDILVADAAATAIGNIIQSADDINCGLALAKQLEKTVGIVIIADNALGVWVEVNLEKTGRRVNNEN
ncbi:MAG: UPF0280 family protein [Clostridiales bacterium]|nr:UPF0280 family protein [Clostridiales bacterium]